MQNTKKGKSIREKIILNKLNAIQKHIDAIRSEVMKNAKQKKPKVYHIPEEDLVFRL